MVASSVEKDKQGAGGELFWEEVTNDGAKPIEAFPHIDRMATDEKSGVVGDD